MANQIIWNGTLVHNADAGGPYDDLAGVAAGTVDTEVFFQGTGSIGANVNNTLSGILLDSGTTNNLPGNTFYFLVNCLIVPLLATKANGGFRIRFCGGTVTDWFEVYVGGSDNWPQSFDGGWVSFMVNVDTARAEAVTNGWTNGTPPATSALRYFGWAAITATVTPRTTDNVWMDIMLRLPADTPGILIEGRDAGTTDWDWDDVAAAFITLGNPVVRYADGGAIVVAAPIQFGISDNSTHGFTDTNKTILWYTQDFIDPNFYGLSALSNATGTTNVTMGVKTGTGDDATGGQGCIIQAASLFARWGMDFTDPNIDGINFYGCTFIHGADFLLNDPVVSVISSEYKDVTSVSASNSQQLKINAIDPDTADGVAFMDTDDLGDIVFSTFNFSDGHAIEILSGGPASQNNKGNVFLGSFGGTPGDNLVPASGSTDAMIYNDSGAAKTFIRTNQGTQPSFRNGASATSDDEANVNITLTGLLVGSVVSIYLAATATLVQETLNSGTSYVFSVGVSVAVDIVIFEGTEDDPDASIPIRFENRTFTVDQSVSSGQLEEPNFIG